MTGITSILSIFLGGLTLSIIHSLIPNHWIPIVTLSRAEGWTYRESIFVTLLAGGSHTLSTVIIGIIIGILGYRLSLMYEAIFKTLAPGILTGLGILYLLIGYIHRGHRHSLKSLRERRRMGVIISLSIAMFFSPCIEIEAYYFIAGRHGFIGILTLSLTYIFITIGGMLILVYLSLRGITRIRIHLLEDHEKSLTGLILIVMGAMAYLLEL